MRICYLSPDVAIPHYRGASTHVYELARNLARLGNDVHVVARRRRNEPSSKMSNGFYIHRIFRGILLPLPNSSYEVLEGSMERQTGLLGKVYEIYLFTIYTLFVGLFVALLVKKYRIDIILERETSFGAGAVASLITGRPLVLELIGPRYSRLSLYTSRMVLAYTPSMIHHKLPASKVKIVSGAVNTSQFRPDMLVGEQVRSRFKLNGHQVIGYTGTFQDWHGIDLLIYASDELVKRFPRVRFLMVGPYAQAAKELCCKMGKEGLFIFTGAVPYEEVPMYLNASDILVAPYNPARSGLRNRYGIGSPLKIFEYMACGKPVVSVDINPINRIIEDGRNGVLVPCGDSHMLAEAITELLEDPHKAQRIGRDAAETVRRSYSWVSFAKTVETFLCQVID